MAQKKDYRARRPRPGFSSDDDDEYTGVLQHLGSITEREKKKTQKLTEIQEQKSKKTRYTFFSHWPSIQLQFLPDHVQVQVLRRLSAIHPNSRYTAIIPTRIPTHFPVLPVAYPYVSSTPVPRIWHCAAKSVTYMHWHCAPHEYVRCENSLTIMPWKTYACSRESRVSHESLIQ